MINTLNALVKSIRHEADDVVSVELRPTPGTVFPQFEPGAHIDLHLPNGMVRSYSLCNAAEEKARYVVGVLKDRASRGGSQCVHKDVRVGMTLPISPPRNNFHLHEDAEKSVLIAGGIGVTPILCMVRRLAKLGRPMELLYLARTRSSAAFLEEIEALGIPVAWHFDDEKGGPPDLKALLAARPAGPKTHYYACGPSPLLDAFEKSCAELGYAHAHIERFAATAQPEAAADAKTSFSVELKRSGREFTIDSGQSILDTLLDAGIDCEYSCQEGICGACETKVISGVPDHRDSVLSPDERASNKMMMICVSGCKSDRLVLDL